MDIMPALLDQNPWWREPHKRRGGAWSVRRHEADQCLRRIQDPSNARATVLLGPRDVGKSVALWQIADALLDAGAPPDRVTYCNLADERWDAPPAPRDVVRIAVGRTRSDKPLFFLFDEIQVHPRWHAWLKQAVDERAHHYLVTGSAASALRTGSRESGLGRWDEIEMEGLNYAEFLRLIALAGESVSQTRNRLPNAFERYLVSSGFPAHVFTEREDDIRLRLREDIAERAILRDLLRLRVDVERTKNLFVYFAQNSGAIFNASNRISDLEINRKTIAKWFLCLQDTRLVVALPPMLTRQGKGPGKAQATLRAQPKVYVSDHGLVSAFAPVPRPLQDPHFRARLYETLVFRHLRDVKRQLNGTQISYWRIRDRFEVDFAVEMPDALVAVEVTAGSARAEKMAKLRAAAERMGATRACLICDAHERTDDGNFSVVPIDQFALDPLRHLMGAV